MDLATLFEMDWYEQSPLTAVLQRHRGRWIHFSQGAPNRDWQGATLLPEPVKLNFYDRQSSKKYQRDLLAVQRKNATYRVPKLGINPRSMWRDPKGIYFYPVDWLLSGPERVRNAHQFGLEYPYYYIADLNLTDATGIDLGRITWQEVEALAKRNGWFEQMQEFRKLPSEQQLNVPNLPGAFFWMFVKRMVENNTLTWSRAYKGVSFVRDPNLGIIERNEPDQVLVLDPRIMRNVEFGENKHPVKSSERDKIAQWMHVLLTIMKQVGNAYGGTLTWNKQRPTLQFTKGWGQFTLTIPERSVLGEVGLSLAYTYGRADNSMYINYKVLAEATVEQIVQMIVAQVERIAARKTDLLFTPVISIEAGKRLVLQEMTDLAMPIKTRIAASEDPQDRYNSVGLVGKIKQETDKVSIELACHLQLRIAEMSASCNLWLGSHHLLSVQSPYDGEFREPQPMFDSMAKKAHENLALMLREFAPSENNSRRYDRHPRFGSTEMVTAFAGWLIRNSGLRLGGAMQQEFAEEIAAFDAYPDKRVLLADIAYVVNSRW